MAQAAYDAQRAEAFAGRMLDLLNSGALAVMISVGHRTGLFDALAEHGDATSQELATAAGLDERYVREWLGAMIAGRIVELDPATGPLLAAGRARGLADAGGVTGQPGGDAQWITRLWPSRTTSSTASAKAAACPYERYARFHEVMAEESAQTVLSVLFSHILPLVPGMSERLEDGASLLDLGCGRGRALLLLAERFPNSTLPGIRPLARGDRIRVGAGGRSATSGTSRFAARSQHVRRGREPGAFDVRHDVRRGARPSASRSRC